MPTTDGAGTLVDANVLIDIMSADASHGEASLTALVLASRAGPVAINPIVYAEICPPFDSVEAVEHALGFVQLARLDLPWPAAHRAAQAFVAHRRAGGVARAPLPDFYIGAHAEWAGLRLLTRDTTRYRTYFPTVDLITP